jgi:DNA-binding IclR family transcriptional regulator
MARMNNMQSEEYRQAQSAMADLKAAIVSLLQRHSVGLTNAQIGRTLGIYRGHEGHEGHISRTLLAMLEQEGLVEQDSGNKSWSLRKHI